MKKALAFLMAAVMLMSMLTACGNKDNADKKDNNDVNTEETDKAAADKVAALIDAIYVQERTEETDAQCEAAKAAWDALTDAQKALVEGEEARITSPTGSFQPFTVHYAQTFILPEGAGAYRVESPQGAPIRVILAQVRG